MNKRKLLAAGALGAALSLKTRAAEPGARTGAGFLTVTGAMVRNNRAPLGPALDQSMVRHGARFEKAWEFDAAMLARLPAFRDKPLKERIALCPWGLHFIEAKAL